MEKELEEYIKKTDNAEESIEIGIKEFVKDLSKLPKPMSRIRKSGYTHLIDTFSYRKKKKEFEVGWGKYYGPMVENGTKKMSAISHLKPLWNQNQEKYYKTMLNNFY